jgi:hypothetical protein
MRRLFVLALSAILGSASIAGATSITYSDRSAWTAALSASPNIVTFEGWGPDSVPAGYTSVTIDGVQFDAPQIYLIDPSWPTDAPYHTSDYLSWQQGLAVGGTLTITLPSLVNAFGLDFGTFGTAQGALSMQFGDGTDSYTLNGNQFAYTFFGIVSDTAFNTVTLSSPSTYPTIDNVSYGGGPTSPAPVPEPASLMLFGSGLFALAARRWRKP